MIPRDVKSVSPAQNNGELSANISIGFLLGQLKKEQEFLGDKLYKTIASNLVAIPSILSQQSPEQTSALKNVEAFLKSAEKFRNFVPNSSSEQDKHLANILLKKDIQSATNDLKEVVYEYGAAANLATTLGTLYSSHTHKFLKRALSQKLGENA